MPKRSSKDEERDDANVRAFEIVRRATDEDPPELTPTPKNPAAVALGRLGGKKGGKARADKLSAERRAEIARQAATKRWGKKDESHDP
jgi:hypothetical protein